jgi:hypothetical protein
VLYINIFIMDNYYLIDFNKNIIVENFKQENYVSGTGWLTHKILNKEDILSPEIIDFLSTLDIPLFINLFYGPPAGLTYIHIDNHAGGWAINYAWGSSNSIMKWYSIKKGSTPKRALTTANTPYFFYTSDQVEIIEETEIKGLCLVRTDIPHSVHNYSTDSGRWCLSIRSLVKTNILEKLSPYIISR